MISGWSQERTNWQYFDGLLSERLMRSIFNQQGQQG
jgi:hypothetical protein